MSTPLNRRRATALFLLMLVTIPLARAEIRLQSWLSRGEQKAPAEVYVNEPLRLNIDIATDYWFSAPARIEPLPQEGLIASTSAISSYNYSQPDAEGRNWSHQRWEIPLFVPRAGRLILPALAVSAQDANDKGPTARQELHTAPLTLDVIMPPLTDANAPWLAAPEASLQQSWQLSQEDLHVGDSIQRQVTLQAKENLSLLLPALLPSQVIEGVASYPDPVQYDDQHQRGQLSASRTESVTYLLQQGGTLTLPPIRLQWWNSQSGELETLSVEGQTFHVHPTLKSWLKDHRWPLSLLAMVSLLLWWGRRRLRQWLHALCLLVQQSAVVSLGKALWQKDWPRCRQLIYQRLQTRHRLNCLQEFSSATKWQHHVEALNSDTIRRHNVLACWWQLGKRQRVPVADTDQVFNRQP